MGDTMLDYGAIGKRIRFFRKKKMLSQEALAEMVWISTTHMSHIETGSTKLSLPVLADLSKALGVSSDEILFGESEQADDFSPTGVEPASVFIGRIYAHTSLLPLQIRQVFPAVNASSGRKSAPEKLLCTFRRELFG